MKICQSCQQTFDLPEWTCPVCGCAPQQRDGILLFAPDLALENDGFPPDAFEHLMRLEDGSFWFRNRNRLLIWALRKYFPEADNLLEVGCGTGYVLRGITGANPALRLAGSEIYDTGLGYARQRIPHATFYQMDARAIPFRDEFAVVGAFDVLEHIEEDQAVLRQMYQAVRPGGGIMLTVPQHPALWSEVDVYSRHVRRYTARELVDKVRAAGFQVTRVTSFVSILLPLMYLSRKTRGDSSEDLDIAREFRIGKTANALLEQCLLAEQALIRLGTSLPAGGSLLVAGYK